MTATVCKFDEPTPTRYERKAWKFMERLQRKCCLLIAVWSMFCFWVSFCSAAHDLDNFVIGLTKINDNPANTVPLKSCYAFCGPMVQRLSSCRWGRHCRLRTVLSKISLRSRFWHVRHARSLPTTSLLCQTWFVDSAFHSICWNQLGTTKFGAWPKWPDPSLTSN